MSKNFEPQVKRLLWFFIHESAEQKRKFSEDHFVFVQNYKQFLNIGVVAKTFFDITSKEEAI